MNKRGQLKVNEFLQVEGHNDIFAIGDSNDFDVGKKKKFKQHFFISYVKTVFIIMVNFELV